MKIPIRKNNEPLQKLFMLTSRKLIKSRHSFGRSIMD